MRDHGPPVQGFGGFEENVGEGGNDRKQDEEQEEDKVEPDHNAGAINGMTEQVQKCRGGSAVS